MTTVPSSLPIELCNPSASVLATRDRIAPGALSVSLREHPIWRLLVTHEGSAYERNCRVADAYRAQSSQPPALLERKKDELLEAFSPVEFLVFSANEALSSFKYEKTGGTILPLAMVVAYVVEPAATSGKNPEYKLRRKKRCADLRAENAV
ncbi:hypothetical protein KCU95_g6410, partial [Aureobasidium melanogenum]